MWGRKSNLPLMFFNNVFLFLKYHTIIFLQIDVRSNSYNIYVVSLLNYIVNLIVIDIHDRVT